jgi:uncharacterized membrane protein YjjB (DUF3815 family)
MSNKQVSILAVVSGLVVCLLFIVLFKDRLSKWPLILIAAALAMIVAEGIKYFGRKESNRQL